MIETPRGCRGMVTAPHHLAAQAGLAVLRDGGNAVEAAVAAAATIAVVYPHMNAIGGEGFLLIAGAGPEPPAVRGGRPAAAAPPLSFSSPHAVSPVPSPRAPPPHPLPAPR